MCLPLRPLQLILQLLNRRLTPVFKLQVFFLSHIEPEQVFHGSQISPERPLLQILIEPSDDLVKFGKFCVLVLALLLHEGTGRHYLLVQILEVVVEGEALQLLLHLPELGQVCLFAKHY